MTLSKLSQPVSAFIAATNNFDIEALMATFADDALVNDHRDEFDSRDAIRNWAQREIVDDRVTMQVTGSTCRGDTAAITANIDGNFDKTGLPHPLVLTFYFSVSGERIVQLIIVHNKPAT
ncbi:MAG: nuclear transport factor 2 family protein [Proteobacteria bacterium]|nr:nuclear transport factor 2 family protein [Pseudomonadota bacterium]MBI3499213.1 nuclear transport factor 2 family protein [Pseudomonadota bacterium]